MSVMLWRVRAELPDRPGALAVLAQSCGAADVNILGLQIFPGVGAVTDELVLRTPGGWSPVEVIGLLESSGGSRIEVSACTEDALGDQPTRYVQAARAIVANPMSFPEVVGRLFDAEQAHDVGADPLDRSDAHDVMEVMVGDMVMQVRRDAAFTATEHARGAALADLVNDVLRGGSSRHEGRPLSGRRIGTGATLDYVVDGADVSAVVDGVVVGLASVLHGDEPTVRPVRLRVEPSWRRRGVGTRLLMDVCRLAHAMGAEEIVLTTESGNQAILPMVMAAGLRGRIRMSGEVLVVRVPISGLKPLPSGPAR